jgi:hypothetical protein
MWPPCAWITTSQRRCIVATRRRMVSCGMLCHSSCSANQSCWRFWGSLRRARIKDIPQMFNGRQIWWTGRPGKHSNIVLLKEVLTNFSHMRSGIVLLKRSPVTVCEGHNVVSKNLVTIPYTSKSSINMNTRCSSIMTNSSPHYYAASSKTISLLHAVSSATFAPYVCRHVHVDRPFLTGNGIHPRIWFLATDFWSTFFVSWTISNVPLGSVGLERCVWLVFGQ